MGIHISNTYTMQWEIYFVHLQAILDMLWQASGSCPAVCSSENSADKQT